MAAGKVKAVEEFSTMTIYVLFAVILMSLSRSSFCSSHETREQVYENILSADDRRILKAMMDHCVDLYLDPFSSLAENLLEDELIRVKKLNRFRCDQFFNSIGWSFSKNGRLTPDCVHELKEEVVHQMMPYRSFTGTIPVRNNSTNDNNGGISDDERRIFKPIMEECVKLFLDAGATDWEETKYDIDYCDKYFFFLGLYYGMSEKWSPKLAPEYVEIMREFPKFYQYFMLDYGEFDEWLFQTCLIEEKHGNRNCDELRLWKAQCGMFLD